MNRWLARFALLISIGMVAVILRGWGAVGQPLFPLPFIQQTSASPSPSPSPSETECDFDPLPPPVCPEPEPSNGTASPSPSATVQPEPDRERHRSRISIKFNAERSVFRGAVRSARKCEPQRDVVLRRARDGRDPVVGRDGTNRRGKWKIRLPGANGRFYATVIKRSFLQGETRVVCRRDTSRTISARAIP